MSANGFLRQVYAGLVVVGWYWTGLPVPSPEDMRQFLHPHENGLAGRGRGALLDGEGPPPGHPERLRPDVPLSETERVMRSQLYV